ncbi:MAG: CRISPR-associated endonuclease Cas1 [Desulfobacterales bacterium]|nr:CRISPR-associated endonuclease Cas1 [Desulfobacterales bacterium]
MQLVINTPGTFVTQKDGIFRLKQEEKKFDVSPRKVESILLTNKAMLSTQAVNLALGTQCRAYLFTGRKITSSIFSPSARELSAGFKYGDRALAGNW